MTTRNETAADYILRMGMDPYEQIDLQADKIKRLRSNLKAAFDESWKRGCEIERLKEQNLRQSVELSEEIERLQALLNAEMDSNHRLSAVELRLRAALERIASDDLRGKYPAEVAREALREGE